jgi:hypothetical protein
MDEELELGRREDVTEDQVEIGLDLQPTMRAEEGQEVASQPPEPSKLCVP